MAGAVLALAPAAEAAVPFTAGTGFGHDLAVGSDGTGHVVWLQDGTPDTLQYCRVPAGTSACDAESGTLPFPDADPSSGANSIGDAQVFTPAAGKVVILASCWACGPVPNGTTDRTFRWISTNGGADFAAAVEIGRNLALNGQAGYINAGDIALGTESARVQAMDSALPAPDTTSVELATGGLFVYSQSIVFNGGVAVWATNDLDTVKYAYRVDASPTAVEMNNAANWQVDRTLSSPEGDNDETTLSSGPSGIFLTYKWFVANDNRLGLRRFDTATNTFGAPVYIEGPNTLDNNSLDYPHHSQDGSGRLHVVWRSLHDDGRLRYTRSDDGGATFSPAANLAVRETFIDPIVEAAPNGAGFAVWKGIGSDSAIRVVPIDPQPEPAGPGPGGGSDTTPPTAGNLGIGDSTLTPGQGTSFTFTSSEAGIATLTVQKQVKGLKVRVRGRRKCVPQTRRRLRALRRRAGSQAEFRRLLRQRRCRAYKRIGRIRQAVTPGQNTIVFNGRIAGRALRRGRYRALLVITDSAGNVSRVEQIRFRVLRRRR